MAATVVGGVAAGAAGTLAMDRLWYARYHRGGGADRFALTAHLLFGAACAAILRLVAGTCEAGRSGRHGA